MLKSIFLFFRVYQISLKVEGRFEPPLLPLYRSDPGSGTTFNNDGTTSTSLNQKLVDALPHHFELGYEI